MNKTYIIPQTTVVKMTTRDGILDFGSNRASIDMENTTTEQLVKENPAGRSDYNVWNDDWSQ